MKNMGPQDRPSIHGRGRRWRVHVSEDHTTAGCAVQTERSIVSLGSTAPATKCLCYQRLELQVEDMATQKNRLRANLYMAKGQGSSGLDLQYPGDLRGSDLLMALGR
ncbi:hypothetical protein D4764_19G0006020 [Takifugu flavidus]|uniref:Uncharacterized protein n=1 Tax=Takifugu flavidus TaxID=433684 RepID=A0A5C6NN35_9TELE|nr:hypothetical protein D4764_19G0006020 [Takifugu flavidus]